MGMVMMFAAVVGFGISGVGALVGFFLFLFARKRGRGSIPIYAIMSLLIPVLVGAAAYLILDGSMGRQGAPTGEDYYNWLQAAFLFGLAPGSGLSLGGIGLFLFSLISPGPRKES